MVDLQKLATLPPYDGKTLSDLVPVSTGTPPIVHRLTLAQLLNGGRTGLVGGGDVNLDGVKTTREEVGQIWWVKVGTSFSPYVLEAGAAAQSLPEVVRPLDFNEETNAKIFRRLGVIESVLEGKTTVTNTFFGIDAGSADVVDEQNNTFVGYRAGASNITGIGMSFFGSQAGETAGDGRGHVFIGYRAGQYFPSESAVVVRRPFGSVLIGMYAGRFANPNYQYPLTCVGAYAGHNTQGYGTTFVGYLSGYSNTTGYGNSFFGSGSGVRNTTGKQNTFAGLYAGRGNTTGSFNSFFGYEAGKTANGAYNTFVGHRSGFSTDGSHNTFVGYKSGMSNATGTRNTAVGAWTEATNRDRVIVIGYKAQAQLNNELSIGSVEAPINIQSLSGTIPATALFFGQIRFNGTLVRFPCFPV